MRIHTIEHANFEAPGAFLDWAQANNHNITSSHCYAGDTLPDTSEFDFLLIMGGPQSPLQIDKFPYLRDEMEIIHNAIDAEKHVLGVCLGAQLIAESLGATTQRSPEKEVGVFPISLTNAGKQDPIFKQFPETFKVAHWHYDMPGIPEGAVLLAQSHGCPHQAFRYDNRVYGFQFHMELNRDLIAGLIKHAEHDLAPSTYTQTSEQMLGEDYNTINDKLKLFLDSFVAC